MELKEQRRAYFRALRQAQSLGVAEPMKPRLTIETLDNFFDTIILRVVEGLTGIYECQDYSYLDSREKSAGIKIVWKEYGKMWLKVKTLDKIIKRCYYGENWEILSRKRKFEDGEEDVNNKEIKKFGRIVKLRDMEKGIFTIRSNLLKLIRKKREESKLLSESKASKELIDFYKSKLTDILESSTKRPLSSTQYLLSGESFSDILQLWQFLNFHGNLFPQKSLKIDLDSLFTSFQEINTYNRHYQILINPILKSFPYVTMASNKLQIKNINSPETIFNSIGMLLIDKFQKDIEKYLGIEAAENHLGGLKLPFNELTWRELARIYFMFTLGKDLGLPEVNITSIIKGKGYVTTPDSYDLKVLKLARRRILMNYSTRDEIQETITGFNTGLCIKLPAPSSAQYSNNEVKFLWRRILICLFEIENDYWLIEEIIKSSYIAFTMENNSKNNQILNKLLECVNLAIKNDISSILEAKKKSLEILEEHKSLTHELSDLKDLQICSITSVFEDQKERMKRSALFEIPPEDDGEEEDLDAEKEINEEDESESEDDFEKDEFEADEKEDTGDPNDIYEESESKNINSETPIPGQDDEKELNDAMDIENVHEKSIDRELTLTPNAESDLKDTEIELDPEEDPDLVLVSHLPYLLQKCYNVLKTIMERPDAAAFNFPVSKKSVPTYYSTIQQPLSFQNIRSFLVTGGYGNSIYAFYSDMQLVFENAITFNSEFSELRQRTIKLSYIFERMFYEMVVCCDSLLPSHDSCHYCRTLEHFSSGKCVVCERCEAVYHIYCLDPPMATPTKKEWYCPGCIEQKSVAFAHPFRICNVSHPEYIGITGEVVGIDVVRQKLIFTVDFGNFRENWSSIKVRSNVIEDSLGENFSAVKEMNIDFEDYDKACAIMKAYLSWGSGNSFLPPSYLPEHSLLVSQRLKVNPELAKKSKLLALLSASGLQSETWTPEEWLHLLKTLVDLNLSSLPLNVILPNSDTQDKEIHLLNEIINILDGKKTTVVEQGEETIDEILGLIDEKDEESSDIEDEDDDQSISLESLSDAEQENPKVAGEHSAVNLDESMNLMDVSMTVPSSGLPTLDEFELGYLSRQKGREEAILSLGVVWEVINHPEWGPYFTISDQDAELSANFRSAMLTVSKTCSSRPADALSTDEWVRGWDNKYNQLNLFLENSTICQFCGQSELTLCSPFVRGETFLEANDRQQRENLTTNIIPGFETSLKHTSISMINMNGSFWLKNFRLLQEYMHGILWKPWNQVEGDLEFNECSKHRNILEGSLPVHECCANFMYFSRMKALETLKSNFDQKAIENLSGINGSTCTPIGIDREGSFYWAFSDFSIFVGKSNCHDTFDLNSNNPLNLQYENKPQDFIWSRYITKSDVLRLYQWLNSEILCEKALKRAIQICFYRKYHLNIEFPEVQATIETLEVVNIWVNNKNKTESSNNTDENVFEDESNNNFDDEEEIPKSSVIKSRKGYSKSQLDSIKQILQTLPSPDQLMVSIDDQFSFIVKLADLLAQDARENANGRRGRFVLNEKVCVISLSQEILWNGKIVGIKLSTDQENITQSDLSAISTSTRANAVFYKIRYENWSSSYDAWVSDTLVLSPSDSVDIAKYQIHVGTFANSSRSTFIEKNILNIPPILSTLIASNYFQESNRACGSRPLFSFSDSNNVLGVLKIAMAMIEGSLPAGAIDESEDRWADNFVIAWRESLASSNDPYSLMQCQIMLEYGIRTAWYKKNGLKMMSLMPSRAHALRNATYSSVALRIWILDQSILYDKL